MRKYAVLFTAINGKRYTFKCWAESSEDAEKQCTDAHEGCIVFAVSIIWGALGCDN